MNRASRKYLLNTWEKVLLYLLPYQKYLHDADAPKAVTQEGIANGIGVGRNNIAKTLMDLGQEGMVDIGNRHVKGLSSSRKVHFLSQAGFDQAVKLKREVEETTVVIRDLEGKEHKEPFGKVPTYLPKQYALIELVLGVNRGEFDCASFHEGKIKEERRWVDFTDKKPMVRSFFGRVEELHRLNELVDTPEVKVIVVQGIAGIGKTTLMAKFAQDNRERLNIFWFKVHEWVNLKGVLRPIGEFLSQFGKKSLEWYVAQTETPNIGEIMHILETDLKGVSAVFVIDDVQKGEKPVTEFLGALVTVLEAVPTIKLILTTRESLKFYNHTAVLAGTVAEMHLEGLDHESAMMLMRERSVPEGSQEEIFRVTHGHPFFMELVEDPHLALGKNIRLFIEQEVYSKLEISERRLLEIASVFRYPIPMDSFFAMEEEIAKRQGQTVRDRPYQDYMVDYDTIELLIRKSLLNETTGRLVSLHDVMREFFYTRMSPRQRALYHLAASEYYLEDGTPPSYVEGLYHSIQAGEFRTAALIAAANGQEVIAKGYANLLAPLLDGLVERCGVDLPEQKEIYLLQGQVLDIQGDWDKALDRYTSLLKVASPEKDRRLIADVNRRIGALHLRRFEYDEAMKNLDTARAMAEELGDVHTLVQVHYDLGGLAERTGHVAEALLHFQKAEELSERTGDDVGRGKAIYGQGRVFGQLRDSDRSVRLKRKALEVLERAADTNEQAKVCSSLGGELLNLGQRSEAISYLEKAVELSNSIGDLSTMGYALSNLSAAYLEVGHLVRAESSLDQMAQIARKLNEKFLLAAMHLYRGYLFDKKGNWDWAKEEFATSLGMMRRANSPIKLLNWIAEVGKVYISNGDLDGARGLLNEALTLAEETGDGELVRQVKQMMQEAGA
ncbi:MAG TPA: tetratricopeptide repeat protein [Methanomassiliicoccales archaeon]|nr:tetratricopeptide repeat protein [Methanomassiliicoccales archaeon]